MQYNLLPLILQLLY